MKKLAAATRHAVRRGLALRAMCAGFACCEPLSHVRALAMVRAAARSADALDPAVLECRKRGGGRTSAERAAGAVASDGRDGPRVCAQLQSRALLCKARERAGSRHGGVQRGLAAPHVSASVLPPGLLHRRAPV